MIPERFGPTPRPCTRAEMDTTRFKLLAEQMHQKFRYHRKLWEYVVIADVFMRYTPLDGKALGFGVGREPLVAFFAGMNSSVLATDQQDGGELWGATGQHASNVEALLDESLCRPTKFRERVAFSVVDMNAIPAELDDRFDFVWSSCAFEHLGTLDRGIDFVIRSFRCLRPGGWAAHTTEFNVGSNADTLTQGDIVLYRRRDFERLVEQIRAAGGEIADPSFESGVDDYDRFVDEEPFKDEPHLKLKIGGYDSTSFLIVAQRTQ